MRTIRRLFEEFTSFEGSLFKYSMAFSLLLALAPALTVFVMLFSYAYLDVNIITNFFSGFLPSDLIVPFVEYIIAREYTSILSIVVSLVVSFWLASRCIYSFLLINATHEEIPFPKWSIRIKSIILFILLVGGIIGAIIIASLLDGIFPIISSVFMVIIFTLLYRMLSFRKKPLSYGLIGGLFSTCGMLILGYVFIQLVTHYTRYTSIYGPLASLVILMLAMYVISSIIYFGFCLNIVNEEETAYTKSDYKHYYFYDFALKVTNFLRRK
ncbi:MAG: YhjD/YihY/BrkB family envelope integrity protein [Erysipelotrichaceae bacterium]